MAPAAGLLLAAVLDTVVIAVDVDVLVQENGQIFFLISSYKKQKLNHEKLTNFHYLSSNRNLRKSVKH